MAFKSTDIEMQLRFAVCCLIRLRKAKKRHKMKNIENTVNLVGLFFFSKSTVRMLFDSVWFDAMQSKWRTSLLSYIDFRQNTIHIGSIFNGCSQCVTHVIRPRKRKAGNEMKVCAKNSAYLWWFCQWYFITHLPHFTWHTFIDAVSHEVNSKHKEQRIGIKELNLCDYCRLWRTKCKPKKKEMFNC